ncbi:MAG: ABC transporter permease [Candidatus Hodarchaeales archaeon]
MTSSSILVKSSYSPSFLTRTMILVQLFLNKYFYDKKTYLLIIVTILPLLTASRISSGADIENFIQLTGPSSVFTFLVMPLISLILGVSAISDEKENKTISQLLTRPVRREEIVLAKWITIMIIGTIIVLIDSMIIFFSLALLVPESTAILSEFSVLIGVWGFLLTWYVVYASIFLLLGIVIDKNAIGWGLAIAYFDAFFGQFIFGGGVGNSAFSIANHIKNIATEYFLPKYLDFHVENFEPLSSILVCFCLIAGSLVLASFVIRNKDFP